MIFRPFYYFDTGCATYVLGCAGKGYAAVVAPQERDLDSYVDFNAAKGMRITYVIDTHIYTPIIFPVAGNWPNEPAPPTVSMNPLRPRSHFQRCETDRRFRSAMSQREFSILQDTRRRAFVY